MYESLRLIRQDLKTARLDLFRVQERLAALLVDTVDIDDPEIKKLVADIYELGQEINCDREDYESFEQNHRLIANLYFKQ